MTTEVADLQTPEPSGGVIHNSRPKTGPDGYPRYEKSLISNGAWETILKKGRPNRKRPGSAACLVANDGLAVEIPVQEQPVAVAAGENAKVKNEGGKAIQTLPVNPPQRVEKVKTIQKATENLHAPAKSRAHDTERSSAATRLSLHLMSRLRNLDFVSQHLSVLQCCSDGELAEAIQVCQSVIVRLNVQMSSRKT